MSLFSLFLIYAVVIVVTRIALTYKHTHAPKLGGFQLHHYMYGVVLVALHFFFPWPVLLAVGIALIVDEIPLFFIFKTWDWPDDHWQEYHSQTSIWSIVAISVLGYLALYFF